MVNKIHKKFHQADGSVEAKMSARGKTVESLCEFNWDNKRKQTANDNIGEVRQ